MLDFVLNRVNAVTHVILPRLLNPGKTMRKPELFIKCLIELPWQRM